jgi:hypothetical protein
MTPKIFDLAVIPDSKGTTVGSLPNLVVMNGPEAEPDYDCSLGQETQTH